MMAVEESGGLRLVAQVRPSRPVPARRARSSFTTLPAPGPEASGVRPKVSPRRLRCSGQPVPAAQALTFCIYGSRHFFRSAQAVRDADHVAVAVIAVGQ